jgi:hypothetical protein
VTTRGEGDRSWWGEDAACAAPHAPAEARDCPSGCNCVAVDDIDAAVAGFKARGTELVGGVERYQDSYRLCYVRGPEGIIVMLAEQIG